MCKENIDSLSEVKLKKLQKFKKNVPKRIKQKKNIKNENENIMKIIKKKYLNKENNTKKIIKKNSQNKENNIKKRIKKKY